MRSESIKTYISKKGNLVFDRISPRCWVSDEDFNKRQERMKIDIISKMPYIRPWERVAYCNRLSSFASCGGVDDKGTKGKYFNFHRRLIITEDGRMYYMKGAKCRRVAKKNYCEYIKSFWNNLLMDFNSGIPYSKYYKNLFPAGEWVGLLNDRAWVRNEASIMYEMTREYFPRNMSLSQLPKVVKKINNINAIFTYNTFRLNFGNKLDRNALNYILANSGSDRHYTIVGQIKALKKYYNYLKNAYLNTNVNVDMLFAKRICDDCVWISDTMDMYDKISQVKHIPKNCTKLNEYISSIDISKFYKLSISEMHDRLSTISRDVENLQNYHEYPELVEYYKNLKLPNLNNYTFSVPQNNLELVRLSTLFSNCVATYDSNIRDNISIILYAYPKNIGVEKFISTGIGNVSEIRNKVIDNQLLCIELRKSFNGFRTQQCYTTCNRYPNDNTIEIYSEFAKENNIKYITH